MIQKSISYVLHCRLENVMAAGFTSVILALMLGLHALSSLHFEMLDIIFIMLPAGILGVKCLLELLFSRDAAAGENLDPTKYIITFFKPLIEILRDWFPFLLLSVCYYSLLNSLALRVNPHLADPTLASIDAWILGNQASFLLEPYIRPPITDFLFLVYFSHVIVFPSAALYFYVTKQKTAFRHCMMGFLTIMLLGIASYIMVPAQGPQTFFANQYKRDLMGQKLMLSVDYIFRTSGQVGYDCFPSLHVGIPLLLCLYLRKYFKKLFIPGLIYVALMCCATIYLRYHYLIDVLAAFVFAPVAYCLNNFLLARWPGEKISAAAAINPPAAPLPC